MTATQIKTPLLLNLDAMSQDAGCWHIPGAMLASGLRLGDVVTVKAYISPAISEGVSAILSIINGEILTGTVVTPTLWSVAHGIEHGDVIRFHADAIWDVRKVEG